MKTIYTINCKSDNSVKYVGQTSNMIERKKAHITAKNSKKKINDIPLYRWMKKNDFYFIEVASVLDGIANYIEWAVYDLNKNTALNRKEPIKTTYIIKPETEKIRSKSKNEKGSILKGLSSDRRNLVLNRLVKRSKNNEK